MRGAIAATCPPTANNLYPPAAPRVAKRLYAELIAHQPFAYLINNRKNFAHPRYQILYSNARHGRSAIVTIMEPRPHFSPLPTIFFIVVITLISQHTPNGSMVIDRQAALEWFQKPAAVRISEPRDQTVVAYLQHSGRVLSRSYDHQQKSWTPSVLMVDLVPEFGRAAIDDHNPPSLLALRDGTILAFTAVHDRTDALGVQSTIGPGDITRWSPWSRIFNQTGVEYNYPQAIERADGSIILFFRMGTWRSAQEGYSISEDGGRTWSEPTKLIDFGAGVGIYAHVEGRGSAIHLAWNVRRLEGAPSELYYAVSPDGGLTWQTSNGQPLSLPLSGNNSETLQAKPEPLFVWDITIDLAGQPHIAYIHGSPPRARYGVAVKENSEWRLSNLTTTRLLYGATHYYAGGIVIDPRDSNSAVLSRGGPQLLLEHWQRRNGRWQRANILATNWLVDNFRPQFVANDPGGGLIWLSGRYQGFDGREWSGFDQVRLQYRRIP